MPIVDVDEATAALVANGRVLPAPDAGRRTVGGGRRAATTLLAVYEPFRAGQAKPAVVLA